MAKHDDMPQTLKQGQRFVQINCLRKPPDRGHGVSKDKLGRYGWADIAGKKGKYREIEKTKLSIDTSYQRSQSVHRARGIASAFDWRAFGTLLVSVRKIKNKTIYYVIDGGHRLLAALMRPDVGMVPCYLFTGLSGDDEANIFVEANTSQKNPSASDIFLARVRGGDGVAQALLAVFRAHGFVVTATGDPVQSNTVKAVSTYYKLGPKLSAAALSFCEAVFGEQDGHKRTWTQGFVATGIVQFASELREQQSVDLLDPDITTRLAATFTFEEMLARAHTTRAIDPKMRRPTSICRALIEAHNTGRRTKCLRPPIAR